MIFIHSSNTPRTVFPHQQKIRGFFATHSEVVRTGSMDNSFGRLLPPRVRHTPWTFPGKDPVSVLSPRNYCNDFFRIMRERRTITNCHLYMRLYRRMSIEKSRERRGVHLRGSLFHCAFGIKKITGARHPLINTGKSCSLHGGIARN